MKAAIFKKRTAKSLDINTFFGENCGNLRTGQLSGSNNVCVLSGGAVASMLAARSIDVGTKIIEGVYTLNSDYDSEYEIAVSPEWLYQNLCTEEILGYEDWEKNSSRILVKDIGSAPKKDGAYRRILGAFSDGENIFVFYEGVYHIIDERRSGEHSAYTGGAVWQFNSGTVDGCKGSVTVCALSQVWLDVIDIGGGISSTLVSAERIILDTLSATKYQKSTLVSTDRKTYKYTSSEYIPHIGVTYTAHYDRVYTDLYPTIGDYPSVHLSYGTKRMVRYRNRLDGVAPFGDGGEKILLLPDMKLINKTGGVWSLSSEVADMPKLDSAVQYFDRLFGIKDDILYASFMGDCTLFNEASDNLPETAGWRMITEDAGGFTAITAFGGKVIAFTGTSMMTVKGGALPFTLSYVGDYGCISQEALASLDGSLYFVSPEGVMCYNGSSVKCISDVLSHKTDYSTAILTAVNGKVVLFISDGGFWLYEPSSGEWSRSVFDMSDAVFAGGTVIPKDGVNKPYRLFDTEGDFSFSVMLENSGRRRVKSISVTASVGVDSHLNLVCGKNQHMYIYDTNGKTVTRTFLPIGFYIDNGKIDFEGCGECTLYSVRIEYFPLTTASKRKE